MWVTYEVEQTERGKTEQQTYTLKQASTNAFLSLVWKQTDSTPTKGPFQSLGVTFGTLANGEGRVWVFPQPKGGTLSRSYVFRSGGDPAPTTGEMTLFRYTETDPNSRDSTPRVRLVLTVRIRKEVPAAK